MTPMAGAEVVQQLRVTTLPSILVDMGHANSSGISAPDKARVELDEAILREIAQALAFLEICSQSSTAAVVIPMADPVLLDGDGIDWEQDDGADGEDDRALSFKASSAWLSIGNDRLEVRVWDQYGDDELVGHVEFSEQVALRDRLAELKPAARRELIDRLSSAEAEGRLTC